MRVRITINNQGGPLDTQYAKVNQTDDERGIYPVKAKLNEMLDSIDLEPGDTVTIEEA